MKKVVFTLLSVLCATVSMAQAGRTGYDFLRLPVSAHAAALGGDNVTISDNDVSLAFSNPALLCNVSNKTIGLNYMNYMRSANTLSASFNFDVLQRGTVAVSAQYMDYGKMKETTSEGVITGDFGAKDISFAGYFCYLLTDRLSAGVTAKVLTSYIGRYNSIGIGVDLGLNFFHAETEWSASVVAKNLGGQVKAYDDEYDPMPIDLVAGVSKRLIHTPVRLNLTFVDLTRWRQPLKNHLVLGIDLIITRSIWVGAGYNFRRASEMAVGSGDKQSSHGAGWSLGAGLNLDRIKVNVAWGKYHVGSSSLMVNLAYSL